MEYAHGDACKMEGGTLATRLYNRLFLIVVVELKSIFSELEVTIFDVTAGTNNSNDVTAVSSHQHFSNRRSRRPHKKGFASSFAYTKVDFKTLIFKKWVFKLRREK